MPRNLNPDDPGSKGSDAGSQGSPDRLVDALRAIRPAGPAKSDPFETFYTAGYQAALAVAQDLRKPGLASGRISHFVLGGFAGALVTSVLLFALANPLPNSNHPLAPENRFAAVEAPVAAPEVASVPAAAALAAADSSVPADLQADSEKDLAGYLNHSLWEFFGVENRSSRAIALAIPNGGERKALTAEELSRQNSWHPMRAKHSSPDQPVSTPRSASREPRSAEIAAKPPATIWQLRQQVGDWEVR